MADLETTQSKLRSTPTAGVSGEHSAYYRRLLSAGYKGYIQGSIGGGSLYGAIGLGIGAVAGLALAPITMGQSLWLIPMMGGGFAMYGAHAFADIGKTAAIIADSADTNEKRRYMLDRYYETPNEEEAQEIKRQLEEQHSSRKPTTPFHWRPALIGAAIGVVLTGAVVGMMVMGVPPIHFLEAPLHLLMSSFGINAGMTAASTGLAASIGVPGAVAALAGVGAAIGGMAGSVIGIDREYIRQWLDKAEFTVHETGKAEKELATREADIERIVEAARRGEALANRAQTIEKVEHIRVKETPQAPTLEQQHTARSEPISPHAIAGLPERPTNQVHSVAQAERLAHIEAAMARPVL